MVKNIAYGEDNGWYVQTACGEEHLGQECDCEVVAEGLTEEEARKLGEKLAEEYNVKLEKW